MKIVHKVDQSGDNNVDESEIGKSLLNVDYNSKFKPITAVLPYDPRYKHWEKNIKESIVNSAASNVTARNIIVPSRIRLIFSSSGPTVAKSIYPKHLNNNNNNNNKYAQTKGNKKRNGKLELVNVDEQYVYKKCNIGNRIEKFNKLYHLIDCDIKNNYIKRKTLKILTKR